MGESISNFAYFPKPKDKPDILGWDAAINDLAVNLALDERWYYDEKDKLAKPILKNYLSYTFERLQYEDEEEIERSKKRSQKAYFKKFLLMRTMLFGIQDW